MTDIVNAMSRTLYRIFDRFVPQAPPWMLLLSGMTLLNLAVLLPAWMEARELNWQRQVMQLQNERLQQQEQNYRQFDKALEEDDPAVLERLAFTQLHLKPVGASPIGVTAVDAHGRTIRYISDEDCTQLVRMSLDNPAAGNVDNWLAVPMAQPGVDYQPLRPLRNRLVRIVTNPPLRMGLAGAAVLCIAASLVPPSQPAHQAHG